MTSPGPSFGSCFDSSLKNRSARVSEKRNPNGDLMMWSSPRPAALKHCKTDHWCAGEPRNFMKRNLPISESSRNRHPSPFINSALAVPGVTSFRSVAALLRCATASRRSGGTFWRNVDSISGWTLRRGSALRRPTAPGIRCRVRESSSPAGAPLRVDSGPALPGGPTSVRNIRSHERLARPRHTPPSASHLG
jgi:hypothetical protein